ncbi:MAG: hypothetical protein BWY76_02448 [bacterium ADurb.Bin429]|nr:MAG: hypothetical protein BWY76_02448 [bacterium ADurb.Bin429]
MGLRNHLPLVALGKSLHSIPIIRPGHGDGGMGVFRQARGWSQRNQRGDECPQPGPDDGQQHRHGPNWCGKERLQTVQTPHALVGE